MTTKELTIYRPSAKFYWKWINYDKPYPKFFWYDPDQPQVDVVKIVNRRAKTEREFRFASSNDSFVFYDSSFGYMVGGHLLIPTKRASKYKTLEDYYRYLYKGNAMMDFRR